jgi:hypothetical protein
MEISIGLFVQVQLQQENIGMTAWLSNSDISDQAQQVRWGHISVLYAAAGVVAAIALLFVASEGRPIPTDAATYFIGP